MFKFYVMKKEFERYSALLCSPNTITGRIGEEAVFSGAAGQACPEDGAVGENELLQQIKVVLPRGITV